MYVDPFVFKLVENETMNNCFIHRAFDDLVTEQLNWKTPGHWPSLMQGRPPVTAQKPLPYLRRLEYLCPGIVLGNYGKHAREFPVSGIWSAAFTTALTQNVIRILVLIKLKRQVPQPMCTAGFRGPAMTSGTWSYCLLAVNAIIGGNV